MTRYLGIDSSTQSCTGVVIDTETREITGEVSVNFGQALPHYGSPNGYLYADDSIVQHSDPLMWVEGLERMFAAGREQGLDWSAVEGIACSGQQHGSVYLKAGAEEVNWSSQQSLAEQVKPLLSRATAPIWMDSSTSEQCREIAAAVGGDQRVNEITGSRATERFTGPQIRKFFQEAPQAYEQTGRIHLVSSFLAWLLTGQDVPIDRGDGAGMNLLDLATDDWSEVMLEATAPGLRGKLPEVVRSDQPLGLIAGYFRDRYGLSPRARVLASSGDNPNSLIGMGAAQPGTVVVSLGTSDTYFAGSRRPSLGTSDTYFAAMSQKQTDPQGYGHVFGNPAGGFMSLICFKNGSLVRDEVARRCGLSWSQFSDAIARTPAGNDGNLMLPYLFPEITPRILEPHLALFGDDEFRAWRRADAAARAVVEAQALSMRLHSQWIADTPASILVTGGGSRNDGILRVLADVFQTAPRRLSVSNSAALGAALRAAQAFGGEAWEALFADFAAPQDEPIRPAAAAAPLYASLLEQFRRRLSETFGI